MTERGDSRSAETPDPDLSIRMQIEKSIGKRTRVSLRDVAQLGESPLIKPLGKTKDDIPEQTGRYRVQGEIARGGVGVVLKALDVDLGRDVAIKFLLEKHRPNPDLMQRFVEEAQISGQLQHPGVIPVYEMGLEGDTPFFTMKLVKGRTLAALLADRKSPDRNRRRLVSTFLQVCQTMAYAHARGVVHRDLKPANIMIGSFGEVLVVDWGMGKVLRQGGVDDERKAEKRAREDMTVIHTVRTEDDGSDSRVGSVFGTPRYMAPEQALGDVDVMDERSDVFALGAILTEILTGEPPYLGSASEILPMVARAELGPAKERLDAADADPELIAIAMDCMQASPTDRPRHAGIVADRVGAWLAMADDQIQEARVRVVAARKTRNVAFASAAVVLCVLGVALMFWRRAEADRDKAFQATQEARAAEAEVRDANTIAEQKRSEAEKARDKEQRQREVAEREGKRADKNYRRVQEEMSKGAAITKFLTDMIALADPQVSGRRNASVLDLLGRAAERVSVDLAGDEPAQALLRTKIGGAYLSIGEMEAAGTQLRQAVDLLDRAEGRDVRLLYEAVRGVVAVADAGFDQEGTHWKKRFEQLIPDVLAKDRPAVASALRRLYGASTSAAGPGGGGESGGGFGDPERWIDDLAACLPAGHADRRAVVDALTTSTGYLTVLAPAASGWTPKDRTEFGLRCWKRALEISQADLGAGHPDALLVAGGYARALRTVNPTEAEHVVKQAAAAARAGVSADHWRLADIENRLAWSMAFQGGRDAEAEELLVKSRERLVRHAGGETSDTSWSLRYLGLIHQRRGDEVKLEEVRTQLLEFAMQAPKNNYWNRISPVVPERLKPLDAARLTLEQCAKLSGARRRSAGTEAAWELIGQREDLIPDPAASPYACVMARWMVYASDVYESFLDAGIREALLDDAEGVLKLWKDRAPLALAYLYMERGMIDTSAIKRLGSFHKAFKIYNEHLEPTPGKHTRWETLIAKARIGVNLIAVGRDEDALEYLPDATEKLMAIEGEAREWNATRLRRSLVDLYLKREMYGEALPHLVRNARSPLNVMVDATQAYVRHAWPAVADSLDALDGALERGEGIQEAYRKVNAARDAEIGDDESGLYLLSELLVVSLSSPAALAAPPEKVLPCLESFQELRRRLYSPHFLSTDLRLVSCLGRLARDQIEAGHPDQAVETLLRGDRILVEELGRVRTYENCRPIVDAMRAAGMLERLTAWALPILDEPPHVYGGLLWAIVYVKGLEAKLYKRALHVLQDRYGVDRWTYLGALQATHLYYSLGGYEDALASLKRPGVEWPSSYDARRAALRALCHAGLGQDDEARRQLELQDELIEKGAAKPYESLAAELKRVFGERGGGSGKKK